MSAGTIDVGQMIDSAKVGRYQVFVIALCGGLMFLDGLDANAVAFIAPSLMKLWHLNPTELGYIFTAGVASSALASLINGPISDRKGRRVSTVIYTALFGIATLASAWAQSGEQFAVLRFIAGIGLGGALPNALALGVEFAPQRHRGFTPVILFSFFGLGQAAGGMLANALVAPFGWEAVVVVGGVLPILLALALALWLPESIRFLAVRNDDRPRLAGLLQKINPRWHDDGASRFVTAEGGLGRSPVKLLFTENRATMTILLLLMSGINNAEIGFLMFWLPIMIKSTGASMGLAVLAVTVLVFSGIAANLIFGRFIDRVGHYRVLLAANICGVVSLCVFGFVVKSVPGMLIAAGFMGIGITGFQAGINSLAASFYPTKIRSTGCGWVIAAGRLFGIAGPMMGGILMSMGLHLTAIFPINAAMVAISGVLLLASWRLGTSLGKEAPAGQPVAAAPSQVVTP